mmetsp:Transcript_45985/g.148123  ORF Transcript_45985/g.148123 Transcript_45985/m.148123 type:complete len:204 (-) Transcript_45985:60-671(-)
MPLPPPSAGLHLPRHFATSLPRSASQAREGEAARTAARSRSASDTASWVMPAAACSATRSSALRPVHSCWCESALRSPTHLRRGAARSPKPVGSTGSRASKPLAAALALAGTAASPGAVCCSAACTAAAPHSAPCSSAVCCSAELTGTAPPPGVTRTTGRERGGKACSSRSLAPIAVRRWPGREERTTTATTASALSGRLTSL